MTELLALGGTSFDENCARTRLAEAVAELKTVRASERARVRERIGHLATELARVLTRSGREHLASAIVPDDVPTDA
jgi:hypothetical protein